MRTQKEVGAPLGMIAATFAMILGMALISSALAETVTKLPLCADASAEDDDSKVVYVKSKIGTGELQSDRVRVTYTVRADSGAQTQRAVWRSDNGKFVLESGALPKVIAVNADVLPSSPAAGGGADRASAANDDPKKAALTLSIEDKDLAPVPSAVAAAVKRDRTGSGSCGLIGKPILPSVSTKLPTYFVTTADACDWGAALGPIWVVAAGNGKGTVVLSSGGYWVKVRGEVTTGFHNLVVGRETASERVTNEYVYNGSAYRKVQ
jgi:hypothetical protein